jgi:multiple sugar transport system permease protein
MWWQLALPLSKNAIAAQMIFWFVGIWNDYFAPSMYLTGETKTVQVVITSIIDSNGSNLGFSEMMASAFIASLPMIAIFLIFRNMFVKTAVTSGVKG